MPRSIPDAIANLHPSRHVEAIRQYVDAGFDEIYINQVGDNLDGFLGFWNSELRGRLGL